MQTTPNETIIPKDLPSVPKPATTGVAALFAQKDRLLRWCTLTVLAAVLSSVLSLCVAIGAARQEMRFVVLDPAGNTELAPGRLFAEAKELHIHQALLATTALLLRNPGNFDLPELLPALFAPGALNQAKTLVMAEAEEFQQKLIHQQPNVARLEAIEIRPSAVRVQVSGQLVRKGTFQQQGFVEPVPFILDLVLKPNSDLLRNRRQPTVVTEFSLRYETTR